MSVTSAFGYEQENGKIVYNLSFAFILDDIEEYLMNRETPSKYNYTIKESISIDEYFCQSVYDQDNSIWRILYMLDGTVRCKKNGSPGEFIYKLK
jgi:hypothetical protein